MVISLDNIDVTSTTALPPALSEKYERLQASLRGLGRVIVAFSGGVDSTLVARVAYDVLGANALAVMAVSPSYAQSELAPALDLLKAIGIAYRVVETDEVDDPRYAANPANRCYFCKEHLYEALFDIAAQEQYAFILDGFNADDTGDHRPGRQAGRERGVRSPLHEAGLDKNDIRVLARSLGLSNWAKPAMACLSSRVAYGESITPDTLRQIDRAEDVLRGLGLGQLRVRHHETLARIEVTPDALPAVLAQRDPIVAALKGLGYVYVTLDLQGFRSGSGNEALTHHA